MVYVRLFVNSKKIETQSSQSSSWIFSASSLQALVLLFGLSAQPKLLAQSREPNDREGSSQYFQQAVEKMGPASSFVWAEPGDNSLASWNARSLLEGQGVIISWEPDKLVVVKPDANGPTTYPGDLVVGLTPTWKSAAYAQVHELHRKGRFQEVLQKGQAALANPDVPRWQQRALVTEMVDAAVSLRQYGVASKIFRVLAQDTPPNLLLAHIPIPWSDELLQVPPSLAQDALEWIKESNPAMQLLGASWLLGGEHRLAAIETLRQLSKNSSELVAGYSKSQLWRTSPPDQILSQNLTEWNTIKESLPIPAQAGPSMLLGYRLEQAGELRLAIAEWIRIATLHQDRYDLFQQALQRASNAAKRLGDQKLTQQINARFSTNRYFETESNKAPQER